MTSKVYAFAFATAAVLFGSALLTSMIANIDYHEAVLYHVAGLLSVAVARIHFDE